MIIRVLIFCSYWVSACAWGGFFNINVNDATLMGANVGAAPATLEQARSSILQRKTQLGIDGNMSVVFQRTTEDNFGNQHLRFNVTYQGIEIEKAQIIVHFNQASVRSINGYQQPLSASFKHKIDAHLSQGNTQLTADQVLAFINPKQHKLLSNKPIIIKTQPYVVWQVRLLVGGIATLYYISDSHPISLLSTTTEVQH